MIRQLTVIGSAALIFAGCSAGDASSSSEEEGAASATSEAYATVGQWNKVCQNGQGIGRGYWYISQSGVPLLHLTTNATDHFYVFAHGYPYGSQPNGAPWDYFWVHAQWHYNGANVMIPADALCPGW
jgi:hypothetical protein